MKLNPVKTYEEMTLEELEENEDEFNEEDERAIELYRLVPSTGLCGSLCDTKRVSFEHRDRL